LSYGRSVFKLLITK